MRKNATIKIQGYYTCKVTNKVVTVQILASNPKGGWEAVNTKTGKTIHIKGPERLIKKVSAPKDKAQANPAKKKTVTKKAVKPSKIPLLDAAAEVLKAESPLTCGQLIERLAETGLWTSDAATPANTLHAALSREIRIKGKESRFEKVIRGQFGLKAAG
jgi:hypothetical protein